MVAFYRIKPEVVQAVQWTGDNMDELTQFTSRADGIPAVFKYFNPNGEELRLFKENYKDSTLVSEGYYIVKDTSGNFSVFSPELFKKKYEAVGANQD